MLATGSLFTGISAFGHIEDQKTTAPFQIDSSGAVSASQPDTGITSPSNHRIIE